MLGNLLDFVALNPAKTSLSPFLEPAYVLVKPMTGWAGNLIQSAKLTASDGAAYDLFGDSVAISGDTVVVGAPLDDIGATNQGSADVFERRVRAVPVMGSAAAGLLSAVLAVVGIVGLLRRRR